MHENIPGNSIFDLNRKLLGQMEGNMSQTNNCSTIGFTFRIESFAQICCHNLKDFGKDIFFTLRSIDVQTLDGMFGLLGCSAPDKCFAKGNQRIEDFRKLVT
jgi:hypothetical protein